MSADTDANLYLRADLETMETAVAAIRGLKENGLDERDLDVYSDRPIEFPHGVLDRPTHMSLVVVLGAIVFCCSIVGFVYYTQVTYPLVTGGMPIFSFWSTGVIFFEITMLGSILTTLGWFIWESGLLRRDRRVPVPEVTPGMICMRVRCPLEQMEEVIESLGRAGAVNVERLQESA